MPSTRFTFWVLIVAVAIAGINQGLTIPMLAIMLEEQGVSSMANGLNAAALYIGILLVSPFLEIPLRKIGYRATILWGLMFVVLGGLLASFVVAGLLFRRSQENQGEQSTQAV